MRMVERLAKIRLMPILAIEWVVALCTVTGGIYILSPLYDVSKQQGNISVFVGALSHPLSIIAWGVILLVGAVLVIIGLLTNKPQLKSIGWFSVALARFFQ